MKEVKLSGTPQKETRCFSPENGVSVERRAASEEGGKEEIRVVGYGCVFEKRSEGLPWSEVVARGAITEETIASSDVLLTIDHDTSRVLARSRNGKGSLKLELDDNGLKYSFSVPETEEGRSLVSAIERGDIFGSSFAFRAKESVWEFANAEKGGESEQDKRTITKIDELFDVSPVFFPAYPDTEVLLRSLQTQKEAVKAENTLFIDRFLKSRHINQ
jgi:HK97 family phage prohead protease